MKRRRIVGSLAAASMVLVSIVAPLTLNSTIARADNEWTTDTQDWDHRCDRTPWATACQHDRDDRDWRNRRDRDWRDRDNTSDRWNRNDRYDRYNRRSDRRLSSGTVIPTRVERGRRIVLRRDEDYPLRLRVTDDVRSYDRGRVVIPEDSVIEGTLIPYQDGYRFEADEIRLRNGGTENINAVSSTLYGEDRDDRGGGLGGILGDGTLISSAASIILESILGRRIETGGISSSVLGGIFDRSPRARRELAVIYPNRDIDLRLTRDFRRD
jgi:hypothetical protein